MVGEAIGMDIDFRYIDAMFCRIVGNDVINLAPVLGA